MWYDGNDIVDWPDSLLAIARTTGTVADQLVLKPNDLTAITLVAATVLDVTVR